MSSEINLKKSRKEPPLSYPTAEGHYEKTDLKWTNIIGITVMHLGALYGAYLFPSANTWTNIFATTYGFSSGFGVTGGVHRLWSHRSYKANVPMRVLLAILFSAAGQNTIPQWVLDHRVHHKYSETDADPHNARRGFFFAHVGWLMQNKSTAVKEKGKLIDMSDVLEDPVVQFHTKYFVPLKILFCFVVPAVIPMYFWDETLKVCIFDALFLRYALTLNFVWLVNSAAHLWGNKPYDRRIGPAENRIVALLAVGEGWHNYHHAFPWDYKTSELGSCPNVSKIVIDFFAWLGWAYDLKSPSAEVIDSVAKKYGDGSRRSYEVLPNNKVVFLPN